jgi:regulator of nucleoside diphosphate kinase
MTLPIDDYSRLRTVLSSPVVMAFSDPALLSGLHQELSRARLVEPDEFPPDVIAMNSTISVRDRQTGALETYTLVYPRRADIANGRLSILSPAGLAVLGCRLGDDIRWPVASGIRLMNVEKVVAPPTPISSAALA